MIIFGANEKQEYRQHMDMVIAAWEHWGFKTHAVDVVGTVPKGMPSANAAMICRLLAACSTSGIHMLTDADMLPLNHEYFHRAFADYVEGTLLSISADAYEQEGKYPICYLIADQQTWKDIVNPHDHSQAALLESWRGKKINEKDDPWTSPFCDESLLRYLLKLWGGQIDEQKRGWTNGIANGRIDRANWHFEDGKVIDRGYIDAHLPHVVTPEHRLEELVKCVF